MMPGAPTFRLAIALSGFADGAEPASPGDRVREHLAWAAASGFRGVALDATRIGTRARDLDRSARRDLAAAMRRAGLSSAGLDLFIPPSHFDDPAHTDRAVSAVTAALGLATELAALTQGDPIVCIALPERLGPWAHTIVAEAERIGARVANCAWPPKDDAEPGPIGIGIDPAAALAAGADPGAAVARAGASLVAVRASDWNGVMRVPVGRGRLDELAFRVAVAVSGFSGHVTVDPRGLPDPRAGAAAAAARWGDRANTATP